MSGARNGAKKADELRAELSAFSGVREVDLTEFPRKVEIRHDRGAGAELARDAIHALLREVAGEDVEVALEALPAESGYRPERRSRFTGLRLSHPEPGRVVARVSLEWEGKVWEAEAEGELNRASELRACATAAARAVEATTGGAATFNVIGVKELLVFDHNLVVVLIYSPQLSDPHLIGTAIIAEDRRRAAAIASLNATNRVVGRFIEG